MYHDIQRFEYHLTVRRLFMSRNRASQAELVARREEIQELILDGNTQHWIVNHMAEKWKTSKRAIQEDIRLIGKLWQERTQEITQQNRSKYNDRLELMFKKAFALGQFKTALAIQQEIHKLNGLYKDKEENKDKTPEFINITKKSQLNLVNGTKDEDEQQH